MPDSAGFMAGDTFSLADIAEFANANASSGSIQRPNHPAPMRWFQEIAQRSAVVHGLKAFE